METLKNRNIFINLFLIFIALLTFYPFFFTVMTSFKDNDQFFTNFWGLPSPMIFANYSDAFVAMVPFMINSLIICVFSIAGILITASLSAYTFARLRFPAKEIIYLTVLALLMIPGMLLLIPQFILLRDLRLLDTYMGIIVGYISIHQAFSIFIMRSFFDAQPDELFEAARIDGCTEIQAYYRIAIPLIKPVMGTVAIMTLLAMWNDYIWPLIVTTDPTMLTVALGLLRFTGTFTVTLFGPMFAAFVVSSLPLIILFLFLMRSFVEGLTTGAIKA